MLAGIALVMVVLGSDVSAHNDVGVFDATETQYNHQGPVVVGNALHCEWAFGFTQCLDSSSPLGVSQLNGFAFTGVQPLRIHAECWTGFGNPDVGGTAQTWITVAGFGTQLVCERSYTVLGGPPQLEVDHWTGTLEDLPGGHSQVTSALKRVNGPWTTTIDSIQWVLTWLRCATPCFNAVGTLDDDAGDDYYVYINADATQYVIADPSGADALVVGGVVQPVVDLEPTIVGAVTFLRAPDPSLGANGKSWTITQADGSPISAEILGLPVGREVIVSEYPGA